MPISSTTRKAGPFIGNDLATTFPFAFKVFQASDLLVAYSGSIAPAVKRDDRILFAGPLQGTMDGVNAVFLLTNNGVPLTKEPEQVTVWQNYPLVLGVGFTLGPDPGQITFTNPPISGDTLFAQGVY